MGESFSSVQKRSNPNRANKKGINSWALTILRKWSSNTEAWEASEYVADRRSQQIASEQNN